MTPSTLLGDPDTFVQWTRIDEPGENPTWESQCGIVEQIAFGEIPMFRGFVGKDRKPLVPKSVLSVVRREVEAAFSKTNQMTWAYSD